MSIQSKAGVEAVCGTLVTLSSIAVALRIYSRKKQKLPLRADDAFACLALVMYIVATGVIFHLIHIKLVGYSFKALTPAQWKSLAKINDENAITWQISCTLTYGFIKLSALFFYRRLFCIPVRQSIDYLTIGTIILVFIWMATFTIFPFFECGLRFSAYWNGTVNKYCVYRTPYFLSMTLSNLILDLWVIILPIPKTFRLRISMKKKFSILGVFLLAFVGIGASIARVVIYYQFVLGGASYSVYHDLGLAGTRAAFTTMLEIGICLVAVNLPSLWLLFTTSILPEHALRTVRSIFSRSSLRSSKSERSGSDHNLKKDVEKMEQCNT